MISNVSVRGITAVIATIAALIVGLTLPSFYFLVGYHRIVNGLEREAEVMALDIVHDLSTKGSTHPQARQALQQIVDLHGNNYPGYYRRVLRSGDEILAEHGEPSAAIEALRVRTVHFSASSPVRIEVHAPLEPLILKTIFAAIAAMAVAAAIFIPLRLLPLRALQQAQGSLRETNDFLSNIMESTTNGILVVDPAGKIIMANARLGELASYANDELVGLPLADLFLEEEYVDIDRRVAEVVAAPSRTARFEAKLVSRGGMVVEISCGLSTFTHNGDTAGAVLSAEDITDRKNAETSLRLLNEVLEQSVAHRTRDLEEINEELRNFAYIVSHDLRVPLVNIRGFTAELQDELKQLTDLLPHLTPLPEKERAYREAVTSLDSAVPEAFSFIDASVKRMDGQIASILKLSRLGQRVLQPEPVDPEVIVKGILLTLQHQLESHKAKVVVGPLPRIYADKTALEQVFGNLLDNGVKYLDHSRPGLVEITAEVAGPEVIFHIRDNGRGIAKGDEQKIFDIFKRCGKLDTPGDGMGLAYVKTLVRRLGGRIWCTSELGAGTTFSVTIPVTETEACRIAC